MVIFSKCAVDERIAVAVGRRDLPPGWGRGNRWQTVHVTHRASIQRYARNSMVHWCTCQRSSLSIYPSSFRISHRTG